MRYQRSVLLVARALLIAAALFRIGPAALAADDSAGRGPADKEPPRAGGALFGRIIDGAGKPVERAEVKLFQYTGGRFAPRGPAVETDQTGKFRFAGLAPSHFELAVEKTGFARAFHLASLEGDQQIEVDVVLKPPAAPVIVLTDEAGKPIAGARLREYRQRGANGGDFMTQIWRRELGIVAGARDDSGRLKLPELPIGDAVDVTVDHPDFAPVRIKDLAIAPDAVARATMRPGVKITLRLHGATPADRPSAAEVLLFRDPFDSPSTIRFCELDFGATGVAQITVEPGSYSFLQLEHSDFYVTPQVSPRTVKSQFLKIEPGQNDDLQFEVQRKVSARGRVVDLDTGRPLAGMAMLGEIPNRAPQGAKSQPGPDAKWFVAGWGETDQRGEYTLSLAAGPARVSFQGESYVADDDFVEIDVAPDGSTVIPDIKVRRLGKVTGVVQDADGKPVPNIVIRLRGDLRWLQPVLSDERGRFEIDPLLVPKNFETQERAPLQPIVAVDPYHELAARADVRVDRPEPVVLKLEPRPADWPLAEFDSELTDWQRGIVAPEQAERQSAISLRGQQPPELQGELWLNTDSRPLRLAGLRGKFVLLDFWSIGCGPCHADFPSVSLLHRLYREHDVVVIGVHDNSQPAEAVRHHVAKLGLPFPVMVDFSDGRTVTSYQKYGIALGIPNYVLIGPDGTVLFDDRTIPAPTLRGYKIEIVRRLLLNGRADR